MELLPCPFCGGKAEIANAAEVGPQSYVAMCTNCDACTRVVTALKDDVKNDLVGLWNARVASGHKLIEALRPFAEVADKLDADWTSGNRYLDGDFTRVRIEAGKFRAARAALEIG